MFVEGDIFKIDGKEHRLRYINKSGMCWLETVIYRDNASCATGGMNRIYQMEELETLEYLNLTY